MTSGKDPPRKRLLQRVEDEVHRKDGEGGETVAAARLPRAHIAVIDSQAKVLGINRSEMIRRILADWTARIVKDEGDGFAPFDDVVVIGRGELEDLRAEAQIGQEANQEMWRIGEIVKNYFGEERNDG